MTLTNKLKMWNQSYVDYEFSNDVRDIDPVEEQSDLVLTFLYHSLPARTLMALSKQFGISEDGIISLCENAEKRARELHKTQ